MKRFLMIAVAGAALTLLIPAGEANAGNRHRGGVLHNVGHAITGVQHYPRVHGTVSHQTVTPYYRSAYPVALPIHGVGVGYAPIHRPFVPVHRPFVPVQHGFRGFGLHQGFGGHH